MSRAHMEVAWAISSGIQLPTSNCLEQITASDHGPKRRPQLRLFWCMANAVYTLQHTSEASKQEVQKPAASTLPSSRPCGKTWQKKRKPQPCPTARSNKLSTYPRALTANWREKGPLRKFKWFYPAQAIEISAASQVEKIFGSQIMYPTTGLP